MSFTWQNAFSKLPHLRWTSPTEVEGLRRIDSLEKLKDYLDWVHIKLCLLKPFFEVEDYPLVDPRSLLPSFEPELFEYKELPGYLMVAFDRQLNPFDEIFQYDRLYNIMAPGAETSESCPLENTVIDQNLQILRSRLPKKVQEGFLSRFSGKDICYLENYPPLLEFLLEMDRAHVISRDPYGEYHLSGVYGSLPADLDTEIKRFGLRIGKFATGDNERYERNRLFVYQFLMELYGFSIVSERRTAAALFSRRLFRMGERFMVRVQGQSDRTITTLYSHPQAKSYPRVEKVALVRIEEDQKEAIAELEKGGFFVDRKRRAVILRAVYRQHRFNPKNVRQDRALSITRQEVIHPLTGEIRTDINILKDSYNMILRLNDIVRGEYVGAVTYKRQEVVFNTETHEKRLKFLSTWLTKHQRRIIGYSEEFYTKVIKVLDSYLLTPDNFETFNTMHDLYQEVWSRFSYIQQARKVKILEDLADRRSKGGQSLNYLEQLTSINDILADLKFEIVNYFDELVQGVLAIGERVLNDRYLQRTYVEVPEDSLSKYGKDIRRQYRRLVSQIDEFSAIRKARQDRSETFVMQAVL
ncbi:hypothetical protein dsx2_0237 [Desulfovibrio sp. X2]|uniref:hypothetical protein n=1 Tax=Desulfovibrio sp. X2 TaxID=941449 RepID=UPI000358E2FC|nr:hypothetical protein [Desulfovibrio sp. X2]EPR42310.1 hypothetical protein dsx2_0237 [Desulfovibrio sp. X2]